jgi:hypothetical protein
MAEIAEAGAATAEYVISCSVLWKILLRGVVGRREVDGRRRWVIKTVHCTWGYFLITRVLVPCSRGITILILGFQVQEGYIRISQELNKAADYMYKLRRWLALFLALCYNLVTGCS